MFEANFVFGCFDGSLLFLKIEIEELHELLKPYLLRRKKENVLKDLPERSDVVLYHGLSALQKKLYKAILTKDLGNNLIVTEVCT